MPDIDVHEVGGLLIQRGRTLAVAESLTGGLLAGALCSVPGISAVFRGGVVAYQTPLKHMLLDVDSDLLASSGAVNPEVARQMAEGVRHRLAMTAPADIGLATTGVAGPYPQDGHPVGTVFVGIASATGSHALRLNLSDAIIADDPVATRQQIRDASVAAALQVLFEHLVRCESKRPHLGVP
ncbi:CinA family protein [Pseudoclavibacter alba]|uniref:CinA family protein n=1 Tax=Pseudoclavibacter albus TaxID=272241 RepID=A0ABT2HVV9_9MICO|nr:CinA family protein [Pseudoclavibacter alba]MCT2042453.1 CinA family protein [Pseudoclavibacter alba]